MAQRAVPMLSYEDVASAADWLREAFGFRDRGPRFTDVDGRVTQVEVELDLEGHRWMFMQPDGA